MGNANPRITSPYYDRYFGPNYNRIVGNTLGDYGQYYVGGSCCPSKPATPALPCSPPPPPPCLAPQQPLQLSAPTPALAPPQPPIPQQSNPINFDLKIQPTQPYPQPPQQISPPLPTFCSNDNYFKEENQNQNGPIYLPPIDLEAISSVKYYDNGLKPPPNFNPPPPPPINNCQSNFLPQQTQSQVRFQNQQNFTPYQPPMPGSRFNITQQQPLNNYMKPSIQQYIPQTPLPPPPPPPPPPSSQPIIQRRPPQLTQQIIHTSTHSINQLPQAHSTTSQTNFLSNNCKNQPPIISSNKFSSTNPNMAQQTLPLQLIKSGQRSKKRYSHYDYLPLLNNNHNQQARSSQLITIDERFGGIYSNEEICGGFISTAKTRKYTSLSKPSKYSYQGHKSLSNFDSSSNSDRTSTYYLSPYEQDYTLKLSKRSSCDYSLDDNKFSKSSRHYFI
jgi:hypothetical protein